MGRRDVLACPPMSTKNADKPADLAGFEKFQKLAALAMTEDDGESTEEARTAAVKAIGMLAEDDAELVVIPRADLDTLKNRVEGASKALANSKAAKREGMVMGAIGGLMLAKSGMLK